MQACPRSSLSVDDVPISPLEGIRIQEVSGHSGLGFSPGYVSSPHGQRCFILWNAGSEELGMDPGLRESCVNSLPTEPHPQGRPKMGHFKSVPGHRPVHT